MVPNFSKHWKKLSIDTGAINSVLGQNELRRIRKDANGGPWYLRRSIRQFKAADAIVDSFQMFAIPVAPSLGLDSLYVTLDVALADILDSLRLDVLELFGLTPHPARNQLVKYTVVNERTGGGNVVKEWKAALLWSGGHLYTAMSFRHWQSHKYTASEALR